MQSQSKHIKLFSKYPYAGFLANIFFDGVLSAISDQRSPMPG
ncbi:hypothetical protein N44_03278 [Microcystis aeruginosa NIES-44]|uniref:Uncharacterized protein n=1 Tax=Microcystis aeruginosa NIES-44 TaxID=449439 RepID=A0A0A1VYU9_MICAE|nr:hypothetical protein N44_03278 [Microcystis aeruginosa NIES-44]